MTLERQDPIPAGVYWIDLTTNGQVRAFREWRDAHPSVVRLKEERTEIPVEYFDDAGDLKSDSLWGQGAMALPKSRLWVLFRVVVPTRRWGAAAGLGFPTISEGEITSSATVQKPAPKAALDYWGDQIADAWRETATAAVARAVGVFALIYFFGSRK